MRNLKKILALVLALVMSMSLVSIASAADFVDADEIDYTEAVEVLTALKVIDGVGGNKFNPEGTVTRAQMAKMITIISLGNVDVTAFKGTTTDLTDINGHWAEAYIKYCYSQGIIAGKGQGVFAPDANVKAVEAAKMLLVALGYNAKVQGYTGDLQWALNVARDAQLSKLYAGLSVASEAELTREQAAQMIYNAVDATLIRKTSSVNRFDGSIVDSYAPDVNNDDLLKETFGVETIEGYFVGNYKTGDSPKAGMIDVGGNDFYFDMPISFIGEKVKVMFKETKNNNNLPDQYDTIYGVYTTGETSVINTIADKVTATYADSATKMKIAGTVYSVATAASGDVLVVNNYGATAATSASDVNSDSTVNAEDATDIFQALSAQNGNAIKFVLNADGKVEKAYVTASTLTTVAAVNNEKVNLTGIGAIKIADNEIYEGIAKNDVVVVTKLYAAAASSAYFIVEKADVMTGKLTGYTAKSASATDLVVIDGTSYEVYNEAAMPTSVAGKTGEAYMTTGDIGENFTVYMMNGFVAAMIQTSESANNYSLVIDKNSGAGTALSSTKLQVMDATGTKTVLTVSTDSAIDAASGYNIGDIITWTGDASNAIVTVKASWASNRQVNDGTTLNYNKTTKTFNGTVTAADAVLFVDQTTAAPLSVAAGDTFKAYNIRSLKDIAANSSLRYTEVVSGGKVVAAFIAMGTNPNGTVGNVTYGIVSAYKGVIEISDVEYNQYTIALNEETTATINIKKTGTNDTLNKGKIVAYAPNSTGNYDDNTGFQVLSNASLSSFTVDGTTYNADVVAIKSYDEADQLLTYYTSISSGTAPDAVWAGETIHAVADDVKVVYIDVTNDKAGSEMGITTMDQITDLFNAIIVENSDGLVDTIIIETSNVSTNIYG